MDPLSQGVFGALWASQSAPQNHMRRALALGGLSGLAADLDVLISSSTDPLLQLEYHRHFTHALFFVPFGALICTLVLRPFFKGFSFKRAYLYAFLGYASHGLLDAFTSYGTQLFWPFSDVRVAWDSIAIIDPLFTLPLLGLLIAAAIKQRIQLVRAALVWAAVYLSFGVIQRNRARERVSELAASRGHVPLRLSAKPSFGNLWVFRGLYETATHFHADAIRIPLFGKTKVYEGASREKFEVAAFALPPHSVLVHDISRFSWFSDGYITRVPELESSPAEVVVSDFRYSMIPNSVAPLWGIRFDPTQTRTHVRFESFREISTEDRELFYSMLLGRDLTQRP